MFVVKTLRDRQEWKFFSVLLKAARGLAALWWLLVVMRAVMPALFAIAMGAVVRAIAQGGDGLLGPLLATGVVFLLLQILPPVHTAVGANLGDRTAAWLHDRLAEACLMPRGMGHLDDPRLAGDLSVARDFDLGILDPPLSCSIDFIAVGLVEMFGGFASAIVLARFHWWSPIVLTGAWLATHWLLRESAIWADRKTDEVRSAQRDADYAYRLAVDAPAAKELRLFGLADWLIDRFIARRRRLHALQFEATRLREKPIIWSLLLVTSANVTVFWALARSAFASRVDLGAAIMFAQCAIGTSLIAFGGLNWAIESAAAPVAAVLRLGPAMRLAGALRSGNRPADGMPSQLIRFRDVTFAYPHGGAPVLLGFNLTIRAGSSLAIVGRNGAGKTTLAKLLCRLYDPQSGSIEVDGIDIRDLDIESWRSRIAAVFQDFIRFELSLADNVAPLGAPDDQILAALATAGADRVTNLDTVLARGYERGTELSGGQWQRIALARALCGVRLGAGVVILDEPTAHLDVRGEAEIFDRILAAANHCTTILISHRFSTVRHADQICVVEDGAIVEIGTHDELIAVGGRYRAMFDVQAQRFNAKEDERGMAYDVLS